LRKRQSLGKAEGKGKGEEPHVSLRWPVVERRAALGSLAGPPDHSVGETQATRHYAVLHSSLQAIKNISSVLYYFNSVNDCNAPNVTGNGISH